MSATQHQAMQTLDLVSLRQLAGEDDVDLYGDSNKFKGDTAYPVQIVEQSVSQSNKGLCLLKLKLVHITASGKHGINTNLTVTLPIFSQRATDEYGKDKLDTIRDINARLLNQLLRATYPESFHGTVEEAGKIVIGAARSLLQGTLPLKGTKCYYARKRGKTGDKLFDSFSATPFDGLPIAR